MASRKYNPSLDSLMIGQVYRPLDAFLMTLISNRLLDRVPVENYNLLNGLMYCLGRVCNADMPFQGVIYCKLVSFLGPEACRWRGEDRADW